MRAAELDDGAEASPYRAVSDGTRRRILDVLAEGERSVSELLERFELSQPALSQHLKVLRDAGLVSVRRDGRRRIYALDPRPLRAIYDWVAHYERFWDERLGALGKFLDGDA
jgi:DNA-binding transcriptional ArsR family regulator